MKGRNCGGLAGEERDRDRGDRESSRAESGVEEGERKGVMW